MIVPILWIKCRCIYLFHLLIFLALTNMPGKGPNVDKKGTKSIINAMPSLCWKRPLSKNLPSKLKWIVIINLYRYGGSSRTASSYYGGSFGGSQDLIDMYGHETDSVFTDEEQDLSFRASTNRINYRYEEPAFPLRKRILSDPAIHNFQNPESENNDTNSDLYVNLHENLSLHSRQASQQSFMRSQQSLNRSGLMQPQRGDTVYGSQRCVYFSSCFDR